MIHLAGLSNDPLGDLNPALTYEINHLATVRLAVLARAAGVARFLYASTCSVYGAAGDDFLDEQSPFNPVTPYAESKMRSEQDLMRLADERFSPVYVRAATAYGASPLLRFDLAVNNLVAWAATTGLVFLKSLGTSWRPLVHIEDIARAYLALLHAPRAMVHNQAFNVGRTEENYRIRDVAELVRKIVPETRIEFADDASADQRNYRVNCDRMAARAAGLAAALDRRRRRPGGLPGDQGHRAQQPGLRGPALQPDRLHPAAARPRAGSMPTCAGAAWPAALRLDPAQALETS